MKPLGLSALGTALAAAMLALDFPGWAFWTVLAVSASWLVAAFWQRLNAWR